MDHPSLKPPAELSYATRPATPGHVEDLLKLNAGCFWASLIWMGWPLIFFAAAPSFYNGTSWAAAARDAAQLLAIPAVFGGVWLMRGTIRRWAAERAAVERGDLLRPGEVVVVGRVLAKDSPLGADSFLQVRFSVSGVEATGRRKASDAAWHRCRVGGVVDVAVDPRRWRRWRVLPPQDVEAAGGDP